MGSRGARVVRGVLASAVAIFVAALSHVAGSPPAALTASSNGSSARIRVTCKPWDMNSNSEQQPARLLTYNGSVAVRHKAGSNSRHAPKKAQDQTFGEQLSDQTSAARPQASSEGHLLPSGCSFGQHQIRYIRASDQQYHHYRSEYQVNRAAQRIANERPRKRIHCEAPFLVVR